MNNNLPRFAIMGSTRGSSLVPILAAWKQGRLQCSPELVFSNRKSAGILDKGRDAGIETLWLPVQGRDREDYDREVSAQMEERSMDFILLIGYMRILSPWFVQQWQGRVVNVHPSLLPKYAGMMDMQIHEAVLSAGDAETGCSVHLVNEEVDGGPVLIQKRCAVDKSDTPELLKQRVQALEAASFLELLVSPGHYLKL